MTELESLGNWWDWRKYVQMILDDKSLYKNYMKPSRFGSSQQEDGWCGRWLSELMFNLTVENVIRTLYEHGEVYIGMNHKILRCADDIAALRSNQEDFDKRSTAKWIESPSQK